MITKSVGIGGANEPDDVTEVQRLLNQYATRLQIPLLAVDGECGHKTKEAIKAFQDDVVGMEAPDGRVDPDGRTWRALVAPPGPPPVLAPIPASPLATLLTPGPNQTPLTSADYDAAAATLACDVAAIKAVAIVECARDAFDSLKRPTILYERHLFHRLTKGQYDAQAPDISNREAGGYGKFSEQYPKLARAYQLDSDAALKACSWGMFQILGENHVAAGFPATVVDYVRAMCQSEREHLNAFVSFIKTDPRKHDALRAHDWTTFAQLYNGPQFHKNHYDTKMADAYKAAGGH
jgi:peptidoglycan hydrolase-like protein with peptidoglycan-binding domain